MDWFFGFPNVGGREILGTYLFLWHRTVPSTRLGASGHTLWHALKVSPQNAISSTTIEYGMLCYSWPETSDGALSLRVNLAVPARNGCAGFQVARGQRRVEACCSLCCRGERRDRKLRRCRSKRGVVGGCSPRERGRRHGAFAQGRGPMNRYSF